MRVYDIYYYNIFEKYKNKYVLNTDKVNICYT